MTENKLQGIRHTCAHLLASAVLDLYPGANNAIGPAIENGFYQDFDLHDHKISEEDFPKIEAKMAEILKNWGHFEVKEVSEEQAKKDFAHNPYKIEIIDDIVKRGDKVLENNPGNFLDICKGGHSENPKEEVKAFKLLSIAGAYWKGSEKNKMLTRVYGTAFQTQKELNEYVKLHEEAKKRDHRKLGKDLDLFVFSDLVGKGLPLFTPKGTVLREELNDFSQGLRINKGYQKVWIPHITKNDLYKTSGHWDKFGDELFLVKSQETEDQMVMKPMNCPHHQQIYASRPRSYRDLPIKYLETTTIYRDEKAGELLGLSRVRSVTQDDAHVFCRSEQIEEVYSEMIEIIKEFYEALQLKYRARLSFRDPEAPEKYLGEPALWEKAQNILLDIAKKNNIDYFVAEGEAAFYGPKIDFMVTDSLGREWQLATPQLDFVQPKRFGLTYVDKDGAEQTPVMIHFALLGSIERFLSVFIEHTGGKFPVWLSPAQVVVIPITDKQNEHAEKVKKELIEHGIRAELDSRNETLQSKIRDHTLQKVPYLGIIGDKEIANNTVSVRSRGGEQITESTEQFIQRVKQDIAKKT